MTEKRQKLIIGLGLLILFVIASGSQMGFFQPTAQGPVSVTSTVTNYYADGTKGIAEPVEVIALTICDGTGKEVTRTEVSFEIRVSSSSLFDERVIVQYKLTRKITGTGVEAILHDRQATYTSILTRVSPVGVIPVSDNAISSQYFSPSAADGATSTVMWKLEAYVKFGQVEKTGVGLAGTKFTWKGGSPIETSVTVTGDDKPPVTTVPPTTTVTLNDTTPYTITTGYPYWYYEYYNPALKQTFQTQTFPSNFLPLTSKPSTIPAGYECVTVTKTTVSWYLDSVNPINSHEMRYSEPAGFLPIKMPAVTTTTTTAATTTTVVTTTVLTTKTSVTEGTTSTIITPMQTTTTLTTTISPTTTTAPSVPSAPYYNYVFRFHDGTYTFVLDLYQWVFPKLNNYFDILVTKGTWDGGRAYVVRDGRYWWCGYVSSELHSGRTSVEDHLDIIVKFTLTQYVNPNQIAGELDRYSYTIEQGGTPASTPLSIMAWTPVSPPKAETYDFSGRFLSTYPLQLFPPPSQTGQIKLLR